MNKITKAGLLSLIAIVQALTLVGGFFAYERMSGAISWLEVEYMKVFEETHGFNIDFGLTPNPFAPLIPLVLFGLLLTIVLLVDQIRNAENKNAEAK
jgi:hypothetical protein